MFTRSLPATQINYTIVPLRLKIKIGQHGVIGHINQLLLLIKLFDLSIDFMRNINHTGIEKEQDLGLQNRTPIYVRAVTWSLFCS